jgi:hypothetical protein
MPFSGEIFHQQTIACPEGSGFASTRPTFDYPFQHNE